MREPTATASLKFAAALLAGGRSTRMGRDKAGLTVGGEVLWRRQVNVLSRLQPAELYISGRCDGLCAGAGVEIVEDLRPECGPLGGIEAIFERAAAPWVMVLAVDLPGVTAEFLAGLRDEIGARQMGVVPETARGFEPLAAIYPRAALGLVREFLERGEYAMQAFVRAAIDAGWVVSRPESDAALFRNLNRPEDLMDNEMPESAGS